MLGSVVLDVAIGMAFVYLLLSLIASVVQEMLSTFMQLRPANLQRAVRSLVSGGKINGKDLVDEIYTHGLVRSLYFDPRIDAKVSVPETKAEKFWAGVKRWDWLRNFLRRWIGIHPEQPIKGVSNQMLLPAYIPSRTFALAMVDLLNPANTTGKDAMDSIRKLLAPKVQTDDHSAETTANEGRASAKITLDAETQSQVALVQALRTLAKDAGDDLAKFHENLESWYNAAMDRASGWYKKYTQTLLLIIGLVLAVTFNVDTIRVARTLWTDKDVRQGMVDAASEYAKQHPNSSLQDAAAPSGSRVFTTDELKKQLQATADQFNEAAAKNLLPIGWKEPEIWSRRRANLVRNPMTSAAHGLDWLTNSYTWQLMLGWLMTAIAISMGAPFWFDTLNKFMVVRGTVKPAEKSAPEGSKDRAPTQPAVTRAASSDGG